MRPRWYGILLAASIAGCTETTPAMETASIHDHFKDGLDPLVPRGGHPCGSDYDLGDGQVHVRHSYLYDALGRLQTDIGVDLVGAPYERVDYTWDHAGHLTKRRDAFPGSLFEDTQLYDTLGRRIQSRNTHSDLDPADEHQIGNTRTTISYRDFDELGNPAHGDELEEDLVAQTSQVRTQSYSYDARGRQTSLEVRTASGELYVSEQAVYDDAALQVRWQVQSPPALAESIGAILRATDQYDSEGRWLSRHQENVRADGAVGIIQDTVLTWDGDRELSEVTSMFPPDHRWTLQQSRTFRYQCD